MPHQCRSAAEAPADWSADKVVPIASKRLSTRLVSHHPRRPHCAESAIRRGSCAVRAGERTVRNRKRGQTNITVVSRQTRRPHDRAPLVSTYEPSGEADLWTTRRNFPNFDVDRRRVVLVLVVIPVPVPKSRPIFGDAIKRPISAAATGTGNSSVSRHLLRLPKTHTLSRNR